MPEQRCDGWCLMFSLGSPVEMDVIIPMEAA
jgi:hypothetical protein